MRASGNARAMEPVAWDECRFADLNGLERGMSALKSMKTASRTLKGMWEGELQEKIENRFADRKGLEGEESTRMDRMPLRGLGWLGEGGDYMKGEKTAARTGTGATGTLPLPDGREGCGGDA